MTLAGNLTTSLLGSALARGNGARVALREPKRVWSYETLAEEAGRAAAALAHVGVKQGETVALLLHDSMELAASLLGAIHIGAIAVPISILFRPLELRDLLKDCGAVAMIVSADLAATVELIRGEVPTLREVMAVGGARSGQHDYHALVRAAEHVPPPVDTSDDAPAFVLYSAGSRRAPRGVAHGRTAVESASAAYARSVLGMHADDRVFSATKLSSAYGLGLGLLFPLACGASSYLLPARPRPRTLFDVMSAFRPTIFAATPSLYAQMVNDWPSLRPQGEAVPREAAWPSLRPQGEAVPREAAWPSLRPQGEAVPREAAWPSLRPQGEAVPREAAWPSLRPQGEAVPREAAYCALSGERPRCFQSVRHAVSGAEGLPEPLARRVEETFGLAPLHGFGVTEALHFVLSNRPGKLRPASVGTPIDDVEVRLVSADGHPVATEEMGHLEIRGPTVTRRYFRAEGAPRAETDADTTDPVSTPRLTDDGWLRLGDRFFVDGEGHYYHCGRDDELFKVGGRWVAPAEIEQTLLGHPAVWECAVVEGEDDDGLPEPHAFVVINVGHEPSPQLSVALMEYVKAEIAPYKYPRAISFVDALPKGEAGQVQRWLLLPRRHGKVEAPAAAVPDAT